MGLAGRFRFRMFVLRRCDAATRRSLLNDSDLFDACCEGAYDQYERSLGGPFQDFLTWLLEHADEIIALVKKIIALFAGPAAAAAEPG